MSDEHATQNKTGRRLAPLTAVRKAIGRRMSESKQQAPHFYVSSEISMDAAIESTATLNEGREKEERVTLTVLMLKALALTLADEPSFNAHWSEVGHELIDAINIGVAMDIPIGLIAPAIVECQNLSIVDLSTRLRDLAGRAKQGKLRAAEMNDATFTLSNLGMYEVTSFTAIVTPPQVAILATGRSRQLPRVVDGEIALQTVMVATLSADHRAVDGGDAARFLTTFKKHLESPLDWV